MNGIPRIAGLVAVLVLAFVLAGCAGGEPSEQTGESTAPGETVVTAETGAAAGTGTGAEPQEPADLSGTAERISVELDAMLTDLRNVESLDELRADLEAATASVESWREQLAAAPEDERLADARASLDDALASLETALADLSSQAGDAGAAELGDLARELTPDNLGAATEVRSALEELLGTPGSG